MSHSAQRRSFKIAYGKDMVPTIKTKDVLVRMRWLLASVVLLPLYDATAAAPGNVASVNPALRDQPPSSAIKTEPQGQGEPTAKPESPPVPLSAGTPDETPRVKAQNGRKPNGGLIAGGAVLLGIVWQTTNSVTFSDLGVLQAWPSVFPIVGPLAQIGVNETGALSQPETAPMEVEGRTAIPLHLPRGLMTGLLVSSTVLQSAGLAMIIAGATRRKDAGSEQLALRAIPGLEVSATKIALTLAGTF